MVLPQLFSDDISSFFSPILAFLSKQPILFYLYSFLQALGALLLPSFNLQFRLLVLDTGLSYRKHKPELKYRNNQTTCKPRTCCSIAKDEIKCQSNAEGYPSRFFMSPMFKKLCDLLLPTFNWKHSICNIEEETCRDTKH